MRRAVIIGASLVAFAGCAQMVALSFDECTFEAGKAMATVDNKNLRRQNRDELTYYCMKARGYDIVTDDADRARASSYKQVRWF